MLIAVGAITRRRPQMFAKLLESFAAMQRPDGAKVIFLFAENDTSPSVTDQLEAFRAKVSEPVKMELEPRPGIPMARNKVLDMALDAGADYLTFVDDDEVVTPDWLVSLIGGALDRGLDLAGGPVRLTETDEAMTRWNRAVLEHLLYRSGKRNAERAAAAAKGKDGSMNIYTNNWALRLAAQRDLGVRFDERLSVSGGSDTRFSIDMKTAGARIGWVPEAWVEEPTPVKRLTLGYHYRRARDQATNWVILNRKGPAQSLWQAFTRALAAILLVLSFPITGRYGVAKAAHKLGMSVGWVRGTFGGKSRHYDAGASRFHAEIGS